MILTETYEPEQVLDDIFFPITQSLDDQKLRYGVVLTGRFDKDPDIDAEIAWALVQNMKEQMAARVKPLHAKDVIPLVGRAKTAPRPYAPVYVPAGLEEKVSTCNKPTHSRETAIQKDDHYYMLKARKRIQEIEDFDQKTWGLAYGSLDVWFRIKEFCSHVGQIFGSVITLASRRIRRYWATKLAYWAEELRDAKRSKNRATRSS